MKIIISAVLSSVIALTGCATASKDISAHYISPMQYQTYDCSQIASETLRIQSRVGQLGGRLDEAAANDKAIAGVWGIAVLASTLCLGWD